MSLSATETRALKKKSETVPCDLCGSSDFILKFTAQSSEFKETFRLVGCQKCGVGYLNPRPTKSEIGKYYPEENYYAYQDLDDRSWNNFRQKVKNFILESQPGYANHQSFLRSIIWFFFQRNLMIQVPYVQGGRILDVGCGNGFYLKWLKEHGWETYGVEISEKACQVAQKNCLKVFNGELLEAKFPSNYFDVVVINQVLEHVYSPNKYVREARRILKPNGLFIVCVPNLGSFEEQTFRENWYALDVPRHLYFFEIVTLKVLLEKNGFEIERVLSKSFGLSWVGIRQSLQNLLANQHYSSSNLARLGVKLKHLAIYSLVRPLAYCLAEDKKNFGVYISFYARKKK